jgi:RNA polymerase II subunit A C-terminal domain phosphatase SSU72
MAGSEPSSKRQRTAERRLRFASICSSNMNRSMETHLQLENNGFGVESFGTGTHVKLPGPSADRPNIYDFGTPYSQILADLRAQDVALYTQNGVLSMLIKPAPQTWKSAMDAAFGQASDAELCVDTGGVKPGQFDVILTFEERVYDAVFESFQDLECSNFSERAVHCINVEVKDSHEEALLGAQDALDLCILLDGAEDLGDQLGEIVERWAERASTKRPGGRIKTFWHTFFY